MRFVEGFFEKRGVDLARSFIFICRCVGIGGMEVVVAIVRRVDKGPVMLCAGGCGGLVT